MIQFKLFNGFTETHKSFEAENKIINKIQHTDIDFQLFIEGLQNLEHPEIFNL